MSSKKQVPQPPERLVKAANDVLAASKTMIDSAVQDSPAVLVSPKLPTSTVVARDSDSANKTKKNQKVMREWFRCCQVVTCPHCSTPQKKAKKLEKKKAKAKKHGEIQNGVVPVVAVTPVSTTTYSNTLSEAQVELLAKALKRDVSAMQRAVQNSKRCCVASEDGVVCAFGRLVTDEVSVAIVTDVWVRDGGAANVLLVAVVDDLLTACAGVVGDVYCSRAVPNRFANSDKTSLHALIARK
jgi:hypothetical protein